LFEGGIDDQEVNPFQGVTEVKMSVIYHYRYYSQLLTVNTIR